MAGAIRMAADFVLGMKKASEKELEITSLADDFGKQGINVDDVFQKPGSHKITFILTMDLPECFNGFTVTDCCYKKPKSFNKKR